MIDTYLFEASRTCYTAPTRSIRPVIRSWVFAQYCKDSAVSKHLNTEMNNRAAEKSSLPGLAQPHCFHSLTTKALASFDSSIPGLDFTNSPDERRCGVKEEERARNVRCRRILIRLDRRLAPGLPSTTHLFAQRSCTLDILFGLALHTTTYVMFEPRFLSLSTTFCNTRPCCFSLLHSTQMLALDLLPG